MSPSATASQAVAFDWKANQKFSIVHLLGSMSEIYLLRMLQTNGLHPAIMAFPWQDAVADSLFDLISQQYFRGSRNSAIEAAVRSNIIRKTS